MTVKELKEMLHESDDDKIIVLSSDAEGNKYSPLAGEGVADGWYVAEKTWCGDVYSMDDKDDFNEGQECIVLYPIN